MVSLISKKGILLFLLIIFFALLVMYLFTNNKYVQDIIHNTDDAQKIYKENQLLKKQIQHSEFLEVQAKILSRENENLNNVINKTKELKEQGNFKLLQATVVSRSEDDWYDKVAIDKGKQHGVKADMAVITVDGFIGRVESLDEFTSIVKLITKDERTNRLAITFSNDESILGFVTGYDKEKKALRIDNIPADKSKEIKVGDHIVTSKLSEKIPPGLEVAEAVSQESDEYGLAKIIYAKPKANFYDLEDIILIESKK
ncbi:rod shape-determining protein MreC [Bacillus pseudomycoides]|uniref:Cell shape-determining protein MreC n=1 Tax=Bacillus bingmayongensis TaxID=1150157 RepID=A0ABU5K4N8_9BACI|nr:rod shape-determining protein MreC [Bacillus pseudomycoides]